MRVRIDEIVVGTNRRKLSGVGQLAESIREVGLLNPITITPDKRLVAGYHRLEACRMLGWEEIEANILELDGLHAELAEIDENLQRNDLTELERAEQLARRKEIYEALHPQAKYDSPERMKAVRHGETVSSCHKSFASDTAAKTGLSPRTIQQDVQIATKILPEVRDAIRETPLADKKVELLKIARMEPEQQKKVAEKIASRQAADVKTAVNEVRKEMVVKKAAEIPHSEALYRLLCGDIREVGCEIKDNSVNAIITDPPYPKDYLDLYDSLAELAARVLVPGGSLVVMVGQSYLPDVISKLGRHLRYHWTLAYLTPGGQSVQLWQRKVNTFWKPVLWFVKGDYTGPWIGDVAKSDVNDNDKRFHHWGQSESGMEDLIQRFTSPGDVILDPFMGGGTTIVTACRLKRYAIGIDIDPESLTITKGRLKEVVESA